MTKIIVTGAEGRFGKTLQSLKNKQFIFKNKKQLNILSSRSISKNLRKYKPKCILHLAGLSRPMKIHNKNIGNSSMNGKKNTPKPPRPGEKIAIDNEN